VKFYLIDKIEEASVKRLVGIKQVSLAEEYLADHFPSFPVLPGVMMLEALVQAAGWVLHVESDFGCSMGVLKEAKNVKYGSFVAPGSLLRFEVEMISRTAKGGTFKAVGMVGAAMEGTAGGVGTVQAVSARIEIAYFNLAEQVPEFADVDRKLIERHRARWALIAPKEVGREAFVLK